MAAAAKSNTVTLSVAKGESSNPTATFSSAMAARMVSLGSGASAHWKVRAQGVEAMHAELYWDGNVLWVRNGGSVGGTYVGGERADDWMQVFDGVEIQVGSSRIAAKVVGPDARNPAGTNPGLTSKSASYIDEEESTMVFANVALLRAAADSMPPAPARSATASVPPPGPARGRVGTMAPPTHGPVGGISPMAAPAPPVKAPAPPVAHEEEVPKPPSSEATVIRTSPYAALEAAGALGHLPAAGNRNPMPGNNQTIAPGSLNVGGASSVMVSASAVSLPVVTPGVRPVTMSGPSVSAALRPVQPVGMSSQSAPGFAVTSQSGSYEDPFGPMDMPPSAAAEKANAVPPARTLILAGITLVIGLVAAILPPPPPPRARPTTTTEVQTVGSPPPLSNNILQLPISEPGLVGVIVPAPIPVDPVTGRPRALPPPNPNDAMKLAADAVAANRHAAALELYERLANEHPEAPLFRQFATVIRARLAAQNCQSGAPGCVPNAPLAPPAAPSLAPSPAPPPPPAPSPSAPR